MIELVPRPVQCAEVFRNHIGATTMEGLATSGDCLQLHNQLPGKPWRPLLERIHDWGLPRRLSWLAHKCIGLPLMNGGTSLPPNHSNSHPLFCVNLAPHGLSKGQSVGFRASWHLQVWFLCYCGHICLSLCIFTKLPFCSALLACPSVNIHMLWGSLW